MLKTCTHCSLDFDEKEFPLSGKPKGRRSSMCRPCKQKYDREHYHKKVDKKVRSQQTAAIRRRNMDFVYDILMNSECADCKNSDPRVLEFDHLDPSIKNYSISQMGSYSLKKLKEEISKCEVVCANCHRIRTASQFNYRILQVISAGESVVTDRTPTPEA